jgi:uncharacterized membrane protein YfcA
VAADLPVFPGLGIFAVALVFASAFVGFFIRGAFGFGSNLPFVLITTWVLGPHHAVVLSVVSAVFAQMHLAPQGVRTADWPVARPVIAGLLIGTVIGVAVFASLAPDWLTVVMASFIIAILLMERHGTFARIGQAIDLRSRRVAVPLATVSGTVGSVSGGGGLYFLIAYLKIACHGAAAVRGTNLMLSVFYQVGRFAALAVAGFVDLRVLLESVALLPAVFAGTWSGTRFYERGSEQRFFRGIQLVLLAAAAALLARGLAQVLR